MRLLYWVPVWFVLPDSPPRNESGKLMRAEVDSRLGAEWNLALAASSRFIASGRGHLPLHR